MDHNVQIADICTVGSLRGEITDLASESLSNNSFFESWLLEPALKYLNAKGISVALVRGTDNLLLGLFPLEAVRGYRRLPVRYYRLWQHLHCFLGTPLIRKGHEDQCLDIFFSWLKSQTLGRYLVLFEQIAADDPVYEVFLKYTRERNLKVDLKDSYERPHLLSPLKADEYLRQVHSGKHRKEFRKKFRRLEELGEVEWVRMNREEDPDKWVEEFLALEASGWKGRAGTAMIQDAGQASFFREAVGAAQRMGNLLFFALTLNGKPIAMRCGFRSGKGALSFKIAFDETYSKFSPGVLMEIEHLKFIEAHPEIEWVDSCAVPGATLLDRLWIDRRPIRSLAISPGGVPGRLFMQSITCLARVKDLIRRPVSAPVTSHAGAQQV